MVSDMYCNDDAAHDAWLDRQRTQDPDGLTTEERKAYNTWLSEKWHEARIYDTDFGLADHTVEAWAETLVAEQERRYET